MFALNETHGRTHKFVLLCSKKMTQLMPGKILWLLDRFKGYRHLPDMLKQRNEFSYQGGSVLFGLAGMIHLWQPADLGIIKMFKGRYQNLVQEEAENTEASSNYTSLDVMLHLVRRAWDSCPIESIRSCWASGGCIPNRGTLVGKKTFTPTWTQIPLSSNTLPSMLTTLHRRLAKLTKNSRWEVVPVKKKWTTTKKKTFSSQSEIWLSLNRNLRYTEEA